MGMIRRVAQQQVQEGRALQFKVRDADYGDGDSVHVQAQGRSTNRSYGASSNIPFSNELGAFLGGLHQAGALYEAGSLATEQTGYMRLNVRQNGHSLIFTGEVERAPIFAYPLVSDGRIEFEVDIDDLPEEIADALA